MVKKCNLVFNKVSTRNAAQMLLNSTSLAKVCCKLLILIIPEKKEYKKVLPIYQLRNKVF